MGPELESQTEPFSHIEKRVQSTIQCSNSAEQISGGLV